MNLYISFFHGRKHPEEQLDDWGFTGPCVGPVQLSWTYSFVKLHDPDWDDFLHLPTADSGSLVKIRDEYFGDFEVWSENDPLIEQARKEGREFLTFEQLKAVIEHYEEFK